MRPTTWLCAIALVLPLTVHAQVGSPLVGTLHEVHTGPGNQSDPHVSGTLIAYTHAEGGASEIRFHDLEDGSNQAIPNFGAFDSLSDIWNDQIVFTRTTAASSALYLFDVSTGMPAVELAPTPEANRRSASIGGGTVAWMDFGVAGVPEILVIEQGADTPVRLTHDLDVDRDPAVSPDGRVVVWVRCQLSGACELMEAVRDSTGWSVQSLAAVEADALPDTNGVWIVYTARRGGAHADLHWQPVGGGDERRLILEGHERNANISGRFVAFEHADPESLASTDVMLYDLEAEWLYRLTDTPEAESLSDVSVSDEGAIRVAWSVPGQQGLDVLAMTLEAPEAPCDPRPTSCEDPGERPLLAELEVGRSCGGEQRKAHFMAAAGDGLLCIENGAGKKRASAAWVKLNGDKVVGPNAFNPHVALVERAVTLRDGKNRLEGWVRSHPHSRIRIRVYGEGPVCGPPAPDPFSGERRRSRPVSRVVDGGPVPSEPTAGTMGCSATGSTHVGAAMMLIVLALIITNGPTRRERIRVRVRLNRRRR